MQPAPAARDAPQVFVWAKLLAFVPVNAILAMVSAAPPEFVSVTVCDPLVVFTVWLPKATEAGVKVTAGYTKV